MAAYLWLTAFYLIYNIIYYFYVLIHTYIDRWPTSNLQESPVIVMEANNC